MVYIGRLVWPRRVCTSRWFAWESGMIVKLRVCGVMSKENVISSVSGCMNLRARPAPVSTVFRGD